MLPAPALSGTTANVPVSCGPLHAGMPADDPPAARASAASAAAAGMPTRLRVPTSGL